MQSPQDAPFLSSKLIDGIGVTGFPVCPGRSASPGHEPLRLERLLNVLQNGGVEFVVLGSVACRAMGIPATPKDLDIIYRASAENISRLSTALQPIAIDFVDFEGLGEVDLSPELLSKSSPLALLTSFGRIDLIQEIAGIRYEDVEFSCAVVNLEGREMRCVSIEIETYLRQIAGREKDQPVLEKLNRVRDAALGSAGSVTARAEPEAPTSAD